MRIAILDLLADAPPNGWGARLYGRYFRKQFMAITPQAVAVWCRSLGHEVHYATYYGQKDPLELIPSDVDVLFVASYTQCSALAYALALIFRRRKVLTVIGGPHARSFPTDCIRFFDLAVIDCDKTLISDILNRQFDPPRVVTSGRRLADLPSVEERMPEIAKASFADGRPLISSLVPMLGSTGCPYKCNFCIDWDTDYAAMPSERVLADLAYMSENWPRVKIGYHDPNFAVRFDEVMNLIERLPEGRRNPYIMESSLSILKEERLPRLRKTNCLYVAPGVESWNDYSNKAAAGSKRGEEKLNGVVANMKRLTAFVPGVQANFLFGGDTDKGDEPVQLTKEFIEQLPKVWPTVNIPTPYGGTPLYDQLHRQGRILGALPFAFYYNPYLAITIAHYDPVAYYGHLIDIHESIVSRKMLLRRLATSASPVVRFIHGLRTIATRAELNEFRKLQSHLRENEDLLAFHEGRSQTLPEFYHRLFEQRLGRYAELLPRTLRQPVLEHPATKELASKGVSR
jgi:radical SAM superfamily enzyme YgiQ (UPF0313 family)